MKSGIKGKVVSHTLNESGDVNYVDVDFGTGKIYENIPANKLKILEMREHKHEIKEEPTNEVDHSTISLASNIDQTWKDGRNMEDDLVDWFDASVGAGGTELGDDLIYSLQSVLKRWEKINDAYTR
jgi:hypothetical protein